MAQASIEIDLRYQDGAGDLSHGEVLAISAIRDCAPEDLTQWLKSGTYFTYSIEALSD